MMRFLPSIVFTFAVINLTGCSYFSYDHYFNPAELPGPSAQRQTAPAQETPELEARAAAEREDIALPPPIDRSSYPNLGSVPPKPELPSAGDISRMKEELTGERTQGAQEIADQAAAPLPQTLPKVTGKGVAPLPPPIGAAGMPSPLLSGQVGMDNSNFAIVPTAGETSKLSSGVP